MEIHYLIPDSSFNKIRKHFRALVESDLFFRFTNSFRHTQHYKSVKALSLFLCRLVLPVQTFTDTICHTI